jgi:Undecaprenyl-phosphate glucose phosphotransferase
MIFDGLWVVMLGVASNLAYDYGALGGSGEDINRYLGSGLAVAVLHAAFASSAGIYRPANLVRVGHQIRGAILIWVMTFVCLGSVAFLLKIGALFSRGTVLLFFLSGIVLTALVRSLAARLFQLLTASRALARARVVAVGECDELRRDRTLEAMDRHGYLVVRNFPLPELDMPGNHLADARARFKDVVEYARTAGVDEVMLAVPWSRTDIIRIAEEELQVLPMPVNLIPDSVTGGLLARPRLDFGSMTLVELQRAPLTLFQRLVKRSIDQLLAALGLFILFPMISVIAAAIRLESAGPAFFVQMRIGFNGRPFGIYKLRTMLTLENGPIVRQARRDDPRVTPLGRLLRQLSIDEIPQLLNVLRGDMSLVGPRPHALAHDTEYDSLIAKYALRRKMKPGITGWAQVNGCRGETSEVSMMQQRIEKDIWYIERWSIWLDTRILLLTVVRVLGTQNAY